MLRRKEDLFGVVDHPKDNQVVTNSVKVRGWVLSRSAGDIELQITIDGNLDRN